MKKLLMYLTFLGVISTGVLAEEFKSDITFTGSSSLAPVISKISDDFKEKYHFWSDIDPQFPKEKIEIYVSGGGSGTGIKSVIEGTSDFGMVARTVKETEKEKIENYKEYVVASDALVIAVNKDNPVYQYIQNLDKETLRKIFSGEYKYWSDLDKNLEKKEILVVTRDFSGGAHEVFQKNIMGEKDVKADVIQAPSMGALTTKILENKYAIGYISYGMYNQNKDKLSVFAVDNTMPTAENIVNGSYEIQRPLLLVTKGELSKTEKYLIGFIYSKDGMLTIINNGYIPVKL